MSVLYVVATPIGNLDDITFRAVRVLGEVVLVAAEDTRSTRKLLTHYRLKARLVSFHENNKISRIPLVVEALEVGDVALVSEAGMPGVSDPGRELVAEVARLGISVVPVPGPSAVTSALAVSGFPAGQFRFLGFLPRRRVDRRRVLEAAADMAETVVIFEAPHRLKASLKDMLDMLGDRSVVVCRELTKLFEEVYRGSISQAMEHFDLPRGEFTLVVEGARPLVPEPDRDAALDQLRRLRQEGVKARDAAGRVSRETGLSRREAYRLWLDLARDESMPPRGG